MAKGTGITNLSYGRFNLWEAQKKVFRVATIIEANGGHASRESQVPPIHAGKLPSSIIKFAEANGITLESSELYFTTKSIEHSLRSSKVGKGLTVTKEEIAEFVANRDRMAQFYDPVKGDFIFASNTAKFVVSPNYAIKINKKKIKVANYITATRITGNYEDNFRYFIKIKDARQR